jgi:hypothetical protein
VSPRINIEKPEAHVTHSNSVCLEYRVNLKSSRGRTKKKKGTRIIVSTLKTEDKIQELRLYSTGGQMGNDHLSQQEKMVAV